MAQLYEAIFRKPMSLTDITALIGAITGPIGLVIAFLVYRRDRAKLLVSVGVDMRVLKDTTKDPSAKHIVVTVSNIGRRSEYVTMVALLFPGGATGMLSDTFYNPINSKKAGLQGNI